MDAVEFVKNYIRMCNTGDDCEDCPLNKTDFCFAPAKELNQKEAGEVVRRVEEWSASHPIKTRQSMFLEQWPNADFDCQDVIAIDPCNIDITIRGENDDCYNGNCEKCRRKFWLQEME